MKCADLQTDVLVDLVDGRLDPAEQRDVERHLEACANCRALVDRPAQHSRRGVHARSARAAARASGRSCRRRSPPNPRRSGRVLAMPARSAAALAKADGRCGWARRRRLILATVIGLLPLMNRNAAPDAATDGSDGAPEVTVESVAAEFEAAEKHYQKAIDDLQTIANKDTGELDPQVAAVLQKNLTVIDQAISESRVALQVAAVEHQRAGRAVRRAAHQGRAAAADRRVDQRNAEGQSSRGGAPDPDPVAVAAYADQNPSYSRDDRRRVRRDRGAGARRGHAARPRTATTTRAARWFDRYSETATGSRADRKVSRSRSRSATARCSICRTWPATCASPAAAARRSRSTPPSACGIAMPTRPSGCSRRCAIDINNFNSRVEVRTIYPRRTSTRGNSISASVDYVIAVPAGAARVAQVDLGRYQRHRTCAVKCAPRPSAATSTSPTRRTSRWPRRCPAMSRRATSARRPRWC